MGPVITRLPDWPERLHALLLSRRSTPFGWGTHDCAQFALAALQALRGPGGVPEEYHYTGLRGAWRVLARLGGIPGAAARHAGPEIPPGLAQRGDIVLVPADAPAFGHQALAVCAGPFAVAPAAVGLARVPRAQWLRAWRG